ncbi:MAG TPA: DUF3078 domain-containing protein [Sunxiuqinia sp.]|nr:DUF3078 domain-containing protein [Sunxiuqinia sp.]
MINRLSSFLFLFFFLISFSVRSENVSKKKKEAQVDSVQISVNYLNYFLNKNNNWVPQDPELEKDLKGLVHFVEDDKIDTILHKIRRFRTYNDSLFFYRPADHVSDSLNVKGYVSHAKVKEKMGQIDRAVRNSIVRNQIAVPETLLENLDKKVHLLGKNEAGKLVRDSLVILPDSLQHTDVVPDSVVNSPADFRRLQHMDSMKNALLENARIQYNNNILNYYIDSVTEAYRDQYVSDYIKNVQQHYLDSIRTRNHDLLVEHNNAVIRSVNDSISRMIDVLTNYAGKDSVEVWVKNSDNDSTRVWLRNNHTRFTRMFLKNEQNDSLGIRIHNTSKHAMQIYIDDAVTLKRFTEQKTKSYNFNQFQPDISLRSIDTRYKVVTPWKMGGDGTFGFTQTALSNWKKGGKSAFSTLLVLKGFANYSYNKVKWENSLEIRNGWMDPADDKVQKNDDKFEFISRYGVSAFKKWYYSAELDFQTQLFAGYNYPDRENKISAFLSPSKTLWKFGLDYKPNKNFSLFLSPFTSKTVYVRDTVHVDPADYGIPKGKKRFWEPGMNADVTYKKDINDDIAYEMKYRMFLNYSAPFSKFDVDWENNVVMRLNDFMNVRMMLHLLYDDNVKFPTGRKDANGKDILEPKWQMKEFITIGFSYNLNKRIFRREKIN